MDISIKDNYSWEILDNNNVVKHCDKSVFEYSQTGVPKNIRDFFSLKGDDIDIKILFNDKEYIISVKTISGRTRLYWKADLKKEFDKYRHNIDNVSFKFSKIENYYILTILINDLINLDTNADYFKYLITEGEKKEITSHIYERSAKLREQAIKIHGTKCKICGFDFGKKYGFVGKDYIEIHHIKPLYKSEAPKEINPRVDLIPVCSNCHRMLHRKKGTVLLPDELSTIIRNQEVNNEF